MTDEEFDVLDELYFVQSYKQLADLTGKSASELIPVLRDTYKKGWIKVMSNVDDELSEDEIDFQNHAESYYYLATKKGLLAHNS